MDAWTLFFGVVAACGFPFAVWAVRLALRSERRDLEIRDIVWSRKMLDENWAFTHSGSVMATQVKIVFTVDGETALKQEDSVASGVPVVVRNPEHDRSLMLAANDQRRFERETAEQEEIRLRPQADRWGDALKNMSAPVFPRAVIPPLGVKSELGAIITWRYPSGVPATQELSWNETYF